MAETPYIMIVDDDDEDAQMLADRFCSLNPQMKAECFSNGQQAFSALAGKDAEELPFALVTDYKMPYMSGPELLSILRPDIRYNQIVKIVLSSSANTSHIQECLRLGAEKYFLKPSNMKQLDSIMDYLTDLLCAKILTDTGFID
jgi:CheY-like chemotaxis protein